MQRNGSILVSIATAEDRRDIYRIRHEVYASELRQHSTNADQSLTDALDDVNTYIVARREGEVLGFVSITPPGPIGYSIDKYFKREAVPVVFDDGLYEVRLLTVAADRRRTDLALLLMYAVLRQLESAGARTVVAIGRREVVGLYRRVGLEEVGPHVTTGAVTYHLMKAEVTRLRAHVDGVAAALERLEDRVDWRIPGVPFRAATACYHGGAFFDAIGDDFEDLARKDAVVSADVLDAWFDPAPGVLSALCRHLPFALKTSPPTHSAGMRRAIARARRVPEESLLCGAGSSDLIFSALPRWVTRDSHVLILDPMYGEYSHVLSHVIGAHVSRFPLSPHNHYDLDVPSFEAEIRKRYDWVVLVNPNSPTGRHCSRAALERVIRDAPPKTRFWIDETYVDYAGSGESLEPFAAASRNVVVCKSMSKAYALSGARAAYLCGPPRLLDDLRPFRPPWAVSLPAQIAACEALKAPDYYEARWQETHVLRRELQQRLEGLRWQVVPGCANFLLCRLPVDGPTAAEVIADARAAGVFLRDVRNMGAQFDARTLRVAVKDRATNEKVVSTLRRVLAPRAFTPPAQAYPTVPAGRPPSP